ncbi:hypothetical protein [Candidatus Pelagibacter sp.]|uniref:hypothetical protein n=1 Tax=Candidatus Pelagibacter sp. TaxID=2024849 RepID=UPI003F8404CA
MNNVEKYPHILENWLKHYISSMNDTGNLIPGDNTGEAPFGVKIIFDGYAENDNGEPIKERLNFAIFIHKDSLTKEFKEHEFTPWALKHRREEECCVSYWFDKSDKSFHPVNYIEEENDDCTKLDRNFVIDLICAIDERDKKSLLK